MLIVLFFSNISIYARYHSAVYIDINIQYNLLHSILCYSIFGAVLFHLINDFRVLTEHAKSKFVKLINFMSEPMLSKWFILPQVNVIDVDQSGMLWAMPKLMCIHITQAHAHGQTYAKRPYIVKIIYVLIKSLDIESQTFNYPFLTIVYKPIDNGGLITATITSTLYACIMRIAVTMAPAVSSGKEILKRRPNTH